MFAYVDKGGLVLRVHSWGKPSLCQTGPLSTFKCCLYTVYFKQGIYMPGHLQQEAAYTELGTAGSLPQVCFDDCSVDHLFHIFVSQTVDYGIQHGNHCGLKHSHHLPLLHRLFSGPPEIHEEESPIKHGNSCQVGPTRGECLPPAIGRAHVQHGRYDECIGNENH